VTVHTSLRQRRNLGLIVGHSLDIYRAGFAVFFAISALAIPYSVVAGLPNLVSPVWQNIVLSLPLSLLDIAVNAVVAGALIVALLAQDERQPASPGASYRLVFSRLGDLLGATYRAYLIVVLLALTIVGIPWAIMRAVRWVFVTQSVVVDERTSQQALNHSARVVEGHWWTTLGRLVAVYLLAGLPGIALAIASFSAGPSLLTVILGALVSALTRPFVAIGLTLVYFDQRLEKGTSLWTAEGGLP